MYEKLEKLINAVEKDDFLAVESLLDENIYAQRKIPLKYIAGALVIAAENDAVGSFNAIIAYNSKLEKSIPQSYIRAAYTMFTARTYQKHNEILVDLSATVH